MEEDRVRRQQLYLGAAAGVYYPLIYHIHSPPVYHLSYLSIEYSLHETDGTITLTILLLSHSFNSTRTTFTPSQSCYYHPLSTQPSQSC